MQTTQTALGTGTQGAPSAAATVSGNAVDDTPSTLFTTLLVAQIRYQNPLEPVDPSEFVGQLTQLSQMEALQNLARQTSANAAMLESLQTLSLSGLVGSEVTVPTQAVNVGTEPIHGSFTLAGGTEATAVVLSAGGSSWRIELGPRPPGNVAFTIDPEQLGLPAGSYALGVDTGSDESPAVGIAGTLRTVRLAPSGDVTVGIDHIGDVPAHSISAFNGLHHS